jgi:high-affinity iron transporter
MLPTFVIGLREGLEAALIVSIVASFLRQRGRFDLLRWVFFGIGAATLLCLAGGIALDILSQNLPQRQQEGLETVIGAVAVVMVTYMVIWMRRHSRELKGQLERATAEALTAGSGFALVAMAFLAVLREGFETSVFLLAAFNQNGNSVAAGSGAVLGIAVAVALGYAIYRGGVRLNLSRFFRATGVVLVLVAAGLVASASHTAHEAGWINFGQQRLMDLTAVVDPGSIQASLLTGTLGIQERPTVIEFIGWLLYLVPLGLYVGWPQGRVVSRIAQRRIAVSAAGATAVGALLFLLLAPVTPRSAEITGFGTASAQVVSRTVDEATIVSTVQFPAAAKKSATSVKPDAVQRFIAKRISSETRSGLETDVYTASATSVPTRDRLTLTEIAALNGGRLPLGTATSSDSSVSVPVRYQDQVKLTWWVEPTTGRVVDVQWAENIRTTAVLSIGDTQIGSSEPVSQSVDSDRVNQVVRAVQHDLSTVDDRRICLTAARVLSLCCTAGLFWLVLLLRRTPCSDPHGNPARELIVG